MPRKRMALEEGVRDVFGRADNGEQAVLQMRRHALGDGGVVIGDLAFGDASVGKHDAVGMGDDRRGFLLSCSHGQILPQSEEASLPQDAVAGPAAEADFGAAQRRDELDVLRPLAVEVGRRLARGAARDRLEDFGALLGGVAGADPADIAQPAVLLDRGLQRGERLVLG